jgi:hypothetical protein
MSHGRSLKLRLIYYIKILYISVFFVHAFMLHIESGVVFFICVGGVRSILAVSQAFLRHFLPFFF